jgi:hypothetical protein
MIRTCDLCLRRAALYPLSYGRGSGKCSRELAVGNWSAAANGDAVADVPETLVLKRHRDLAGRSVWWRRVLLALLVALLILALVNLFGQRPATARASSDAAVMSLYAPTKLRGGLLWTARIHITAKQDIKQATLVLDPGWMEGMQINSLEPSPIGEASRDGKIALDLGHIPAGRSLLFFMAFQVNATNVGHRSQNVELDDGVKRLLTISRAVTFYP